MAYRKDCRGRVLRKGEYQRKSDNMYGYIYRDSTGKRHRIYSKDLIKLREKIEKINYDHYDGIDTFAAKKITVNEMFDRCLSTKVELRETTRTTYIYMYDRFVREGFGLRRIVSVKYSDVMKFFIELTDEKHLATGTIEGIYRLLSPAFALTVRDDLIRKNPCDGVMREFKQKSLGIGKRLRSALSEPHEKAFMYFVVTDPTYEKWTTLFMFLFSTGCRIGEAIGIRWEDIDLEKRRIHINHQLIYGPMHKNDNRCSFSINPPKTAKGERFVPIVDDLYRALIIEYERQDEEGFCQVELDGMSGFVFSNRFGNLLTPSCVNRALERARAAYNSDEVLRATMECREPELIPHFSCHQMRHTFATRLCEVESNLETIQTIMGHADIQTTMDIYAEATETELDHAIESLSQKKSLL